LLFPQKGVVLCARVLGALGGLVVLEEGRELGLVGVRVGLGGLHPGVELVVVGGIVGAHLVPVAAVQRRDVAQRAQLERDARQRRVLDVG
jgi:hypothetical protein